MITCDNYDYRSTVDEAALKYAKEVLGETSEVREKAVKEIREYLLDNSHIRARTDDLSILYFLRSCKFNIDKTKRKINNYYKMRAERIEWFQDRNPFSSEIKQLLDIGVFLPLRVKDENNRQVVIIRTSAHDPKYYSQNDVLKTGKMILDFLLSQDELISVYGIRAVFDMQGVTLHHGLQMTPKIIKRSVQSWECYPCRIGMLEFINAPIYVNVILDIFRSFMSKKIKERVLVRRGMPSGDFFPVELGGKTDDYKTLASYWKNVVQENKEWFVSDDYYKSVEEINEDVFETM